MPPKVSVIIPTYNSAQYITEAIDSVLNQTYKDFEIIVVDDGSADNTREVLVPYMDKNLIRYIYQENKGPGAARNTGIKNTNGKYITFLDADDEWHPEMLEKCVPLLDNGDYDWVVPQICRIVLDDRDREISREIVTRHHFAQEPENLYVKLLNNIFAQGFKPDFITARNSFEQIGTFEEQLLIMEDRDMWIRFAEKGLVLGIVPEPLYIYFIRPNSLTRRHKKKVLECGLRLIEKWKEKAFIMDQSLKKGYAEELWNLARKALYDTKDYKLMFRCALKSQIYNPSLKRIMKSFPSALLHTLRSLRDFD